jgi:hypothetical protein
MHIKPTQRPIQFTDRRGAANLDGGVATRVEDLASLDLLDDVELESRRVHARGLECSDPDGHFVLDSDPTRISDLERKLTRSSFAENDVLGFGSRLECNVLQ